MSRSRSSRAKKLADAAPVFAALGDQTRLNIVTRLCADGPQSIVRLTEGTGLSRQAITKHLQALADAGLVDSTRDGRRRMWAVRTKRIAQVRDYLDQISQHWDDAIERLRMHVEEGQDE